MDACIFCRIVKGEIPSAKVHEDKETFAFLDIAPLSWGHVLIIPKKHYESVMEMPAGEVARLASVIPKLAGAVIRATGAGGLNVLQNNGAAAGQAVAHLHVHLIPRVEADGLGYRWNAKGYPEGLMKEYHGKILDALGGK